MSRNSIQDIVIKRENVRRVPPPHIDREKQSHMPPPPLSRRPIRYDGEGKWYKNKWALLFIGTVVFIIFFLLLSLNKKVEITVIPKSQEVTVDFTAFAGKNVVEEGDDLSFTVFSVEDSRTAELPSSGVKEVDKRAEGRIIIFNNYSSEPQRLVARTRFESTDGKIFRIPDAVVVPGVTVRDGENIPGSLEVTVLAEEPGSEYNVGFTDFTIPGLKGTPLFDNFFARTKTEIKGGFSGLMNVIDEGVQDQKQKELQDELASALILKIEDQVTNDFVTIQDGFFSTFSQELNNGASENGEENIPFTVRGTMHTILFNKKELSKVISKEGGIEDAMEASTSVANLSGLTILIEDKDLVNPTQDESITISISGSANIVWNIPEEEIKNALVGKDKERTVYTTIFTNQFSDSVIEAQVTDFKPFWSRKFPNNPDNIDIIIKPAN